MSRCCAALLLAFSGIFLSVPSFAKAPVHSTIHPKPVITRTETKPNKAVVPKTASVDTTSDAAADETEVRSQSSVIENDDDFKAPQGALYTTSDDCA